MKTIPPWLRKIIDETETPEACKKAVWRMVKSEWDATHPRKKNKPGPRKLDLVRVFDAVDKVLERLTSAEFAAIEWREFFSDVQGEVGDSPRGGLYHETVLRPLVMECLVTAYEWVNLPPKLFTRREPWMPADRFELATLRLAFYREKVRQLPEGAREDYERTWLKKN